MMALMGIFGVDMWTKSAKEELPGLSYEELLKSAYAMARQLDKLDGRLALFCEGIRKINEENGVTKKRSKH